MQYYYSPKHIVGACAGSILKIPVNVISYIGDDFTGLASPLKLILVGSLLKPTRKFYTIPRHVLMFDMSLHVLTEVSICLCGELILLVKPGGPSSASTQSQSVVVLL